MKVHPVCEFFPMLKDAELREMADSIAKEGLLNPCVQQAGLLLDGRNRIAACKLAGVEPRFVEYTGDSPVAFIIGANLTRRHLEKGQKIALAVELEPHFAAEARERMVKGTNQFTEPSGKLPEGSKGDARDQVAAVVGVSGKQVSDAKAIKKADPELFEEVKRGDLSVSAAKRKHKEKAREKERTKNAKKVSSAAPIQDLEGSFSCIVIDPPWSYDDEGDVNPMGRAKHPYASMTIEQVTALPIGKLANADCHLYLWITNRSLPKGFSLLEAWGFRYVTCLTWVKPSFGMGNYFRGQTEQILFGVRGSLPLLRKDAGTALTAPRGPGGHSSKPDEFYELVESCSPGPFLDVFGRRDRKGWRVWGEGHDS